jgi:pyruvate carboxylase subunit B
MLEAAYNGVDCIDVAMEPLSWGMIHPDVITVQAMLKDAGYAVKDINMDAYMEARRLTQAFMDDFLGYFIDPGNKIMTSLLVGCGLPGGMMGSMMADLKGMHSAINLALKQNGKKEVTLNNLVVQLFNEVEAIWPMLGYPPLVTPFSQYVKNVALMNIFAVAKDEPRFSMIDKDSWNMILGRMGRLPGKLAPEIVELAKANKLEFYEGDPQAPYPDELDRFRKEMQENGWDEGPDQEELFEFAMHERQYRDMRSGAAKNRFNQELEQAKEKAGAPIVVKRPVVEIPMFNFDEITAEYPMAKPIHAPSKGQVIWQYDLMNASTAPFEGSTIQKCNNLCYIQTVYGIEPVPVGYGGTIVGTYVKQGDKVEKGQILAFIN